MKKPTEERERELLAALVKGQQARGYSPSMRELADEIGISLARVSQLMDSCRRKGWVTSAPRVARAHVVHLPKPSKKESRR